MFHVTNGDGKKDKPVVFLQHGLMSLSDTWLMNTQEDNVVSQFLNAGYDVWLGNNRGNKYSSQHVSLNPDTDASEFFNYSFQELGEYDLKA